MAVHPIRLDGRPASRLLQLHIGSASREGRMVSYLDKHRLDGRIALVTGGGRAIGLACSHALAESGARVVIADVDPAVAEAGRSELAGLGFHVETVPLDVTKPDQVTQVADDLN